jgi:uroporphyrinogen decarboxylase
MTLTANAGDLRAVRPEPALAPARPRNDLLLRACRGQSTERPPVWMMRQAGRYLPEYQAVRRSAGGFLNMVRTPALAAEVTVQPVDIVGVDAAIIFSDILVIPNAMGMALEVDEGIGPHFDAPIRTAADVARLRAVDPHDDLAYVLEAIRLTQRELAGRVPLIGFAGGPWTLAAYMIEGRGTKHFQVAKRMLLAEPALAHALLDRMATAVGEFLVAQAAAGAQVLQLFESWAGALAPAEFRAFVLPYLARAARIARGAGVPLVVFAPGAGWAMREIAAATEADVVGIDWQTEAADARRLAADLGVAVQGNLDPCALYAPPAEIRARTREMLRQMPDRGYVANLGHGILPDVPVAHARAFIDTVREWRGGAEA